VIVLDTSGVIALASRTDPGHEAAVRFASSSSESMIVPAGIMAEIAHVLTIRAGERAVLRFLYSIISGKVLWHSGEQELSRVSELMVRYGSLPLGYADATVVAAAERQGGRVPTFDHRHFGVIAREGVISIVP